ncbi:hypothetical protein V5799_023775 [Amblyomma americanum]|uniref:Uncharacterized protein n=1 Tax=Amblyomma americanum TaxID=6943 RepID=A0AAQ4FGW3_AMBAM
MSKNIETLSSAGFGILTSNKTSQTMHCAKQHVYADFVSIAITILCRNAPRGFGRLVSVESLVPCFLVPALDLQEERKSYQSIPEPREVHRIPR